ncbi:MAG: hypothetical protein HDR13_13135 [Lachnospiraceae bacterium]|nr:hypothetical protein [Lachnospiraceae bacterium]
MSITVVLQQMVMIFILIAIGILLYKKEMLSEVTAKQISGIIVNVTNPALLICSAFQDGPKVSLKELGFALGIYLIVYTVLIVVSFLIPRILRVPGMYHYAYQMLTIFGNVGFIGIPLASAVLGTQSLIFVSIYNLIFNILIYTFGISVLHRAEERQMQISASKSTQSPDLPRKSNLSQDAAAHNAPSRWKKLINAGTISAAATIIFYLGDFHVPVIVSSTLTYMGQATTLLSMLVLGVSVAQMAPKDIFSHPKLYGFTLLRQILVPIGCIVLFRPLIQNPLILNTMALMLAVPAANMPLMLSKQLHVETDTISQGIILTTILSLGTIPVVSFFL